MILAIDVEQEFVQELFADTLQHLPTRKAFP